MIRKFVFPVLQAYHHRICLSVSPKLDISRVFLLQCRVSSILTHSDTIYALSSGQGKCGVAVIRVSGPRCADIFHKMTSRKKLPKPREAILTLLRDHGTGDPIDKALALWFPAPHSFTGEDVCEFHVHGGTAVIQAVFNCMSSVPGLRPAEAGDFTKRAFLNDKLDLTEVEGLGDLIHAETEEQRKQALRQMEGRLSEVINSWSKTLLNCLAHVEAYIDFGEDQHIEENVLNDVADQIHELCKEIKNHLEDNRCGERLRSGVKLAIIGQPNVGKSSLLNLITCRPAAIVSSIPGTTRDVVETALNIGGFPVVLCDTAGLRFTSDLIEREGVNRARERAEEADLILLMLDLSRVETGDQLWKSIQEIDKFFTSDTSKCRILIFNKCDLIGKDHLREVQNEISKLPYTHSILSCRTESGLKEFLSILTEEIKKLCVGHPTMNSPSLTQQRHRVHVKQCLEDLQNSVATLEEDVVIAAEYLRFAMNQLGKLTGKIGAEDILDVIFKDFCIGK